MKTTTVSSRHSTPPLFCRLALLLIPTVFVSFALSPAAQATCQQGCLTNENTVFGDDALLNNTNGTSNTAMGFNALYSNTGGINNTGIGGSALLSNTTGFDNTAMGYQALTSNTTGYLNTATGNGSLSSNTTGSYNTATGNGALTYNTTGNFNTAAGLNALLYNATGANNIALGFAAGSKLTTGSHNIDIGSQGLHGEAGTIRIGNQGTQTATFIAGISGATVPTGVAVIVDGRGHLGTITSSERFKENIQPMNKASEAILALKPVTFRYKHELDPDSIPQFGLVAEQVEKVNPDLVTRDEEGKPYAVRYEAVNAMLLDEFLKEHRKNEEQQATIECQQKQIDTLTAGLQKFSAQLELTKSAPQTVRNNR